MSLPYALMPVCRQQFCNENGDPYAYGSLEFYEAGTTTPAAVYTAADGLTELGTSLTLDAGGYAPAIYLAPGGYKVILKDAFGAVVWTQDGVEDVGLTFLNEWGKAQTEGSKDVTDGYIVLEDDQLVTVASTGGANPCNIYLPPALEHLKPVVVKNMGTIALAVWPNAGDTIDGINDKFTVPAATTPTFPALELLSDGASSWYIKASHGL